jgi:DegV family protein with EDD domain
MLPGARLRLVDTKTTSMGLGYVVLTVARAAEQGATLEECQALAERASTHTGLLFMVDTLKYLHLGGRIGGGARFLGTALNLKPILELRDGKIEAVERVRTKSKALERLLDLAEERIGGRKPVHLATLHAKAEAEATELLSLAKARFGAVESILSEVSPTVGTHTGPGTVGIAFMAGM